MIRSITKCILIITIFCFGKLSAQDIRRTIQLNTLASNNIVSNIASVNIISNLADSVFIGVAPAASPNVRTNVVVPQGVRDWLQEFVHQQFGDSFQPGGKKLLWAINDLRVGKDSSSTGTISFTKISADVYSSNNTQYQQIGHFDTLMISQDPNVNFGETVAAVINVLYQNSISIYFSQYS